MAADPTETRLLDLLKLVNDWLKFAEAKNVGIVGPARRPASSRRGRPRAARNSAAR